MVVFQTGTLTEDGLDLLEVIPVEEARFAPAVTKSDQVESRDLLLAMAACHSLMRIDGELTGDPLDVKLFEWTKWQLEEDDAPDEENRFDTFAPITVRPSASSGSSSSQCYGIIHQFPFSPKLQRMSVVSRELKADHFSLLVKGSPEMIRSLCTEGVPADFSSVLTSYTQQGLRVIALACRQLSMRYLQVQRAPREELECELTFLGLVGLENRLKPQTKPVIESLLKADIRCIMATGDNTLTALSVARECGLVDPKQRVVLVDADENGSLKRTTDTGEPIDEQKTTSPARYAITGRALELVQRTSPAAFQQLCVRGTVFARMSPDQKQMLLEGLQYLHYFVGMCGDGANDCGALKAAHMGISLSAEASIASPFTAKDDDIGAVPTVIREGRAALVTVFGVFKYMAAYSVTQHVSVLFLYWIGGNMTGNQFLYIDLALVSALVFLSARTEACKKLSKYPPPTSLISKRPIISLLAQLTLMVTGLSAAFVLSRFDPDYKQYEKEVDCECPSFENTAVFSTSLYMYITQAIIYAKGKPYRKTIVHNRLFLLYTFLALGFSTLMVLYPDPFANFFALVPNTDFRFRLFYVGIGVVHFILSWLVEDGLVENNCWRRRFARRQERRSVKRYRLIERELNSKQSLISPFDQILRSDRTESSKDGGGDDGSEDERSGDGNDESVRRRNGSI